MASNRGVFQRLIDYFTDDADRIFTVVVLALILGGLACCFGDSCHVTISISSKAAVGDRQ